jgi:hypothetical protein
MMRLVGIAATIGLLQACSPQLPVIQKRETVLLGVSRPIGQQTLDSIYWYTGFRPDSMVVAPGILRLAMPAGSVGQEIESSPSGNCTSPAIPFGAVLRLAREAWRNAGQSAGADTVIITVGELQIEKRTWGGHVSCGAGPAMMRIGPSQLRGSS